MRLISLFPKRSGHDPAILKLSNPAMHYPAIRNSAVELLKGGHISDVVAATYARLFVDEYQDCSLAQHAIAGYASLVLPTCVLGDPLQAIFGFSGPLVDWSKHVRPHFQPVGELNVPWRWKNAGAEDFGLWLLESRRKLLDGQAIELAGAPKNVTWVHLDGTEDHVRRLKACRAKSRSGTGSVLIIGDSINPRGQRDFASQTPGATTVESVDLRDFVSFAQAFDLSSSNALKQLVGFAEDVMTNVGGADLLRRVEIHQRGTARVSATDAEQAALKFRSNPSHNAAIDVLVEIGKQSGVRAHRPGVLQACIQTLKACKDSDGSALYETAIRTREQSRMMGRPLPRRAVGSTLLLKGLEAEVAVVLNAAAHDPANLYVAITRGSEALVVCSATSTITPARRA